MAGLAASTSTLVIAFLSAPVGTGLRQVVDAQHVEGNHLYPFYTAVWLGHRFA